LKTGGGEFADRRKAQLDIRIATLVFAQTISSFSS
jgi:hypothetical protein